MEETTNEWGDCPFCGDEISLARYWQFVDVAHDFTREAIDCGDSKCHHENYRRGFVK